jgi:hypothetical protein
MPARQLALDTHSHKAFSFHQPILESTIMRLLLDPEWIIDCDNLSCNLIRLRTISAEGAAGRAPKEENIGKQREEIVGFYGTLQQAATAYLEKRVKGSTATTANEIIDLTVAAVNAVMDATKDIPRAVLAQA